MPVSSVTTPDPKSAKILLMSETALPSASIMDKVVVSIPAWEYNDNGGAVADWPFNIASAISREFGASPSRRRRSANATCNACAAAGQMLAGFRSRPRLTARCKIPSARSKTKPCDIGGWVAIEISPSLMASAGTISAATASRSVASSTPPARRTVSTMSRAIGPL